MGHCRVKKNGTCGEAEAEAEAEAAARGNKHRCEKETTHMP